MTREEAIQFIKNIHESRLYEGKLDYLEHNKMLEAIETLSEGTTPDPETGLVPCGCGGVARVAVQYAYPDERRVFCERCGLTTIWLSAPMSVLQFHWNRAMGWKGGEE